MGKLQRLAERRSPQVGSKHGIPMNNKSGKWSRKYTQCIRCEKSDSKYMGRGLCSVCYLADYTHDPANKDRIDKSKKKYYINTTVPMMREIRERVYFDGNRELALRRDNYKCNKCNSSDQLVVHHKDETGRGAKEHNNDLSNLETLCRGCHINLHRPKLVAAKKS